MIEEVIKLQVNDYEELALPSNGLGPQNLTHIMVRPMTMVEEKILSNKTIAKSGKTQQEIFKSVISTGIIRNDGEDVKVKVNLDQLLVEDEFALLLFVRAISYGRLYETKINCPSCGTEFDASIDLETDVRVDYATEETPKSIVVKLPMSGKVVTMRYPQQKDVKGNIQDTVCAIVESIEGVDETIQLDFLRHLKTGDFSVLRKKANQCDFGVNRDITFTCDNSDCDRVGEVQEVDFPITSDFFCL